MSRIEDQRLGYRGLSMAPAPILTVLGALVVPVAALVAGAFLDQAYLELGAMALAPVLVLGAAGLSRKQTAARGPTSMWTWVVVAALSVLATQNTYTIGQEGLRAAMRPRGDAWPTFDLSQGEQPTPTQGYVEVSGYVHDQWVLDEYRTGDGARPDQTSASEYVLTPMLGTREVVVESVGSAPYILVARLSRERFDEIGAKRRLTLRGQMREIDRDVVGSLVTVQGEQPPLGAMLDTELPEPEGLWVRILLALLAIGLALTLGLGRSANRATAVAA